jgi:hypothetical protein
MAARSLRDPARLIVDLRGLREAHLAAEKFDRFDLRLGGCARGAGDERQTEQASEIGSEIAVEPDEDSTTGLPRLIQPLQRP